MKAVMIIAFVAAGGNAIVSTLESINRLMALTIDGVAGLRAMPTTGNHLEWAIAMVTCGLVLMHIDKGQKP